MDGRPRALVIALIVTTSVACRVAPPWHLVFPHPGEVRFFEADPWFHVRQAHATVAHYPFLNRWDRGTHYPGGERGMNQGLFDWGMASAAMVLGLGHPADHLVDLVAAWTPVFLSLVLLALVYWTARRLLPTGPALLATALLALTPGSLATYSMLGFADHHILEDVLRVAMLGALVQAWQRPHTWWLAVLPTVMFLYSWPGASVDLAIAGLALLLGGTVAAAQGADVRPAMTLSFRYGLAVLLLYFAVAWVYPDAVMWEESQRFILLGSLGIALFVPLWIQAVAWLRSEKRLVGAGILVCLLAALGVAARGPKGRWALDLLLAPRSPLVAEQQPATVHNFFMDYGLVGILALCAVVALMADIRSRRQPPAMVLLLVFSISWLGLWWHTWDFVYAPPPFLALLVAAATANWRPAVGASLVAGQVLLCGLGLTAWPWPSRPAVQGLMTADDDWMNAMAWLHTSTPPIPPLTGLGPFHDPIYPPGSYGVFTAWDDGEYVAGPGGRPCLWSEDMTPDYARWLFTTDETVATHMLDQWAAPGQRVRYLVLGSRMGVDYLPPELQLLGASYKNFFEAGRRVVDGILPTPAPQLQRSMWYQLYRNDAVNLSHFRLVYETPGQVVALWTETFFAHGNRLQGHTYRLIDNPGLEARARDQRILQDGHTYMYGATQTSAVKIFEAVPGAHLVGRDAPDSDFAVTLELRARSSGRSFDYRLRGRTDATGSFDAVVPYSTSDGDATDVVATRPYRLDFDRGARHATVSPQDVESGATVEVSR